MMEITLPLHMLARVMLPACLPAAHEFLQQRLREAQALAHALAVLAHVALRRVGEAHAFQHLAALRQRGALQPGEEVQRLQAAEVVVEDDVFRQVADFLFHLLGMFHHIQIADIRIADYARRVATLRQSPDFNLRLTVEELVAFGRFPYSRGALTDADQQAISEAIQFLSLEPLRQSYLDELSGGASKAELEAAMKGHVLGNAQIFHKHANIIVNLGGATSADVRGLIELAQETVRRELGYELKPEIGMVGEF